MYNSPMRKTRRASGGLPNFPHGVLRMIVLSIYIISLPSISYCRKMTLRHNNVSTKLMFQKFLQDKDLRIRLGYKICTFKIWSISLLQIHYTILGIWIDFWILSTILWSSLFVCESKMKILFYWSLQIINNKVKKYKYQIGFKM